MAYAQAFIAAAQIGIQFAQMLTGASEARKNAKQYLKIVKEQSDFTVKNFKYQANANTTRYMQEAEAIKEQAQQVYLENLAAKSQAEASAASSGVAGNSIDSLFKGYDRAIALNNFMAERNIRNLGLQYDQNWEALRANAVNSIYNISPYTGTPSSSYIMQGISGIFNTAASAANSYGGSFKFGGGK